MEREEVMKTETAKCRNSDGYTPSDLHKGTLEEKHRKIAAFYDAGDIESVIIYEAIEALKAN
jgi:hypothetical protein